MLPVFSCVEGFRTLPTADHEAATDAAVELFLWLLSIVDFKMQVTFFGAARPVSTRAFVSGSYTLEVM